jgi:hypothetical protein
MARRTQIVDALVDHLAANTDALPSNVFKRYLYLDDINDWPTITMMPQTEARIHRGADARQGIFTVFIRGYVYSEEDSLGTAETFAQQIDSAIDTFADTYVQYQVEEARVIELRTDEGLFHPYGMADITLQVVYEVSNDIK